MTALPIPSADRRLVQVAVPGPDMELLRPECTTLRFAHGENVDVGALCSPTHTPSARGRRCTRVNSHLKTRTSSGLASWTFPSQFDTDGGANEDANRCRDKQGSLQLWHPVLADPFCFPRPAACDDINDEIFG